MFSSMFLLDPCLFAPSVTQPRDAELRPVPADWTEIV